MLTASVHQLCLAGICCSIVGWALSTTLVCYACREVTKCSIFNTKSSPPGAVSKWLRANGFNVGVCIIYFAKAEFYCALLFSASLATTCIATAWSVLFPDDAAIVEMKYFESASLLAGSSDRDVFVASAAFVIVAACGYFVFLMVLQYFRAGLGIIPFFVGSIGGVITKSIRWHIDTTWTFLTLRYFAVSDVDYLNDKRPLFESVDMVRLRYGKHEDECYNYIFPTKLCNSARLLQESGVTFRGISRVALRENEILARKIHRLRTKTPNHPVAYFHGGGFVAANACVLTQSVVPIARGGRRGGFEVYAADYPMGQDGAFPMPILSGLKLLRHMRAEQNIATCHIYGDSAGACVASYVAALVCNPQLLHKFQRAVKKHHALTLQEKLGPSFDIDEYDDVLGDAATRDPSWFPSVATCLSVYGVLDGAAWRAPVAEDTTGQDFTVHLSNTEFQMYASCLAFVTDLVYVPTPLKVRHCYNELGFFVADILARNPDISFPRSLLVCGNRDPLLLSSLRVFKLLSAMNVPVGLLEADARHAFVGVPPCLMTEAIATPTAVEAADKAILNFLESNGSDFGSETKLNDAANGGSGRTRS